MKRYLIGIDLGTTNAKGIIFDEDGVAISSASATYPLIQPGPNMVEQRGQDWWSAAADILKSITDTAGENIASNIQGICVSSHIPSLLPLDREGNILRNALIWMDKRSHAELDCILDTIGLSEYVNSAGAQPDVAFLPCKILWYKNNEPELFHKTHRILQASSYINYKLTGQMTMDIDQASLCQCLDLRTLRWSESISRAIGADLNSILPEPISSDTIIGHVTAEAASATGLKEGIPVVAGASDATASMYATGLCKLGEAAESSGTTALVFVGHDRPSRTDIPIVAKPCAITGMPYFFNAPINTYGASINWYLSNMGQSESEYAKAHNIDVFDHINNLALQAPAGCNGLIYFPYLLGERAPLWNSYARGMFIGLSLDTESKHILRSVFEGTGFALRHVMDTIKAAGADASCLRITGGGARSRTWSQIKASILRMPVMIMDEKSGSVPFGDALIAGHALGIYPDLTESIQKLIQVKEVIEPVDEWSNTYDKLYPFYIEMYQHLDNDLSRLKKVMDHLTVQDLPMNTPK